MVSHIVMNIECIKVSAMKKMSLSLLYCKIFLEKLT